LNSKPKQIKPDSFKKNQKYNKLDLFYFTANKSITNQHYQKSISFALYDHWALVAIFQIWHLVALGTHWLWAQGR
jgi:hypothetical protein